MKKFFVIMFDGCEKGEGIWFSEDYSNTIDFIASSISSSKKIGYEVFDAYFDKEEAEHWNIPFEGSFIKPIGEVAKSIHF